MCELGSLQSDWPVDPPSARIWMVYIFPGVSPLNTMCRESPEKTLGSQSPASSLQRPSYILVFFIALTFASSSPAFPFLIIGVVGFGKGTDARFILWAWNPELSNSSGSLLHFNCT